MPIINVQCNAFASDDRDLWRSCSNVPRPCLTIPRRSPIYLPELSNTVDENLFATSDTSYHGHNDVSAARIFPPIALCRTVDKFRNTSGVNTLCAVVREKEIIRGTMQFVRIFFPTGKGVVFIVIDLTERRPQNLLYHVSYVFYNERTL